MQNRLYEKYKNELTPKLLADLKLSTVMEVPRLKKIVVNCGIGGFRDDKAAVETFVQELAEITGQHPSSRKARLSEAGFKIRRGDVVGLVTTLRGLRMWVFLDKLISLALPRVKDFKGLSYNGFDELGNYSIGIRDHTIFSEVNPNTTKGIRSLQLTLVVSAKNKDHGKSLLKSLGLPLV
ncbi:MAG: 50S ribosomal protein L5 [candidate division WWE3 bacterium GW2011_GWA1_46_21]|uniref:Large ribosomal subunit protein uL5 n=3 Tax=Katanobacteria TaxID=422282 RepID=A0A0G1RQE5_UNCKA|nr:MAG: 50S ribosomal protein L5 [candidate division WWE3 bacterium GW2011_GWA1_46_21]KKU51344.1 MAG: 50S ribosomal protein L5 [candidate division WWE3 bacterium GW2011_GWC1_47_10]KKU58128.1 MAG: 50S ribosomal protein L5 [candidate division WWE3 bacterium GW2011_GWB1_47_11]